MEIITEKNVEIIEQWYKDASSQTLETLPQFMNHVLNDYRHDYGTICKAIGACAIAAAWAANASPQGGITGFQAGAVMWEFIRNWNYRRNKCGLKIVDIDDMLYPQYGAKFDKTITKRVMVLSKKPNYDLQTSKRIIPYIPKLRHIGNALRPVFLLSATK